MADCYVRADEVKGGSVATTNKVGIVHILMSICYWLIAGWLLYRGVKLDSTASVLAGGVVIWFQQQPVQV